jgi:hypothetical protein
MEGTGGQGELDVHARGLCLPRRTKGRSPGLALLLNILRLFFFRFDDQ